MRSLTPSELGINALSIAWHYLAFQRRPLISRRSTRDYQLKQLKKLIAHAYEHVPLYREKYTQAGVTPQDLRALDDLAHFPTATKDEILASYPHDAIAGGIDLRRCILSKSSGSTGQVITVVHRANQLGVQGLAMNRLFSLYGSYLPWHRLAYIYTSEYPARSLFGMYPMTFIPTLAPIAEISFRIRQLRPRFLACYPSHLHELAAHLSQGECQQLQLKAISVSSELSTQQERDRLAELFGCAVYDEYSSEELTHIAAQCREKTYHIFEDLVFLEILSPDSGQPLPSGTQGSVVGTYLHNYAMPFIRYHQGDQAVLDDAYCPCGLSFRGVREISGRKLDQFILPSGRILSSGWLLDASYSFLLDLEADIAAFTMTQETVKDVCIEIVPGPAYTAPMSEAIKTRLLELVGEPINVRVDLVRELKRSTGGKHHPIISHLAHRTCAM